MNKTEITTEELRKYSIFVGAPMYGGNCTGLFCKSTNDLSKVCAQYGIELKFYYLFNESLVQRARNYVTDEFLRSDCTHLMFIDSDIGFKPKDVLSLLALQVSEPEKYDIITGPYPKKSISWDKVEKAVSLGKETSQLSFFGSEYVFNVAEGQSSFRLDTPVEVSEAGTGFMLIPRSTLEKYAAAYPELSYLPDHRSTENFNGRREITAFFDCEIDPDSRRYLSEDYFFCRNARKIGINLHMCPWMELQHVGSYTFRGSMAAQAMLEKEKPKQKQKRKTGIRP